MSNDQDTLSDDIAVFALRPTLNPPAGQHPIELEFAALLDSHIDQLRSRGVHDDVLHPYERELKRCLPRSLVS